MADDFNPYLKWLGIPLNQQPPNPYQLLGVQAFEADPDVIDNAANRQMAHVRSMQAGPHAAYSQKLLTELSNARVVLLDPQRKVALDQQLLQAAQAATPAMPVATPITSAPTPVRATPIKATPQRATAISTTPTDGAATTPGSSRRAAGKKKKSVPIEIAKVVVGGALGLGIAYFALRMIGIDPFGTKENVEVVENNPGTNPDIGGTDNTPVVQETNPFQPMTALDSPTTTTGAEPDPFNVSLPLTSTTPAGTLTAAQVRVHNMSTYTLQDVNIRKGQFTIACTGAKPMLTAPGNMTTEQKQARTIELMRSIAMFATEYTFCAASGSETGAVIASIASPLNDISDTDNKRRFLGAIADRAWNTPDKASNGILLVGEVKSLRLVNGLYETQIQLRDQQTTIAAYSWKDPATACEVGSTVLSFGVIVENPADNLTGYTGSASKVVWTRHYAAVEVESPTPSTE